MGHKPKCVRRKLWISLWISLGISFGPSHPLALNCKREAVDQFVGSFSRSVFGPSHHMAQAARHGLCIRLWIGFKISLGHSHIRAQRFETHVKDQLRDRFRRSQPTAQTCETQAVDQVVDQLWDRCREAPCLKPRLARHGLWNS